MTHPNRHDDALVREESNPTHRRGGPQTDTGHGGDHGTTNTLQKLGQKLRIPLSREQKPSPRLPSPITILAHKALISAESALPHGNIPVSLNPDPSTSSSPGSLSPTSSVPTSGHVSQGSGTSFSSHEPSIACLPPSYAPKISMLSHLRSEAAPDLSQRISRDDQPISFAGSLSTVFQARLDNEHLVAVKAIRGEKFSADAALRKFTRETATWWCLRHRNILPLYGYVRGTVIGLFAGLVSPWCGNGTAAEYLERNKDTLKAIDRIHLFHGVANGVHYLHTLNPTVIHGDLKPASSRIDLLIKLTSRQTNVLIDDEGVAKICDFGLLSLIREEGTASSGLTTKSVFTGTPRYLSYELLDDGCRITLASDVYALACIGMEFLYSIPPHAKIPMSGTRVDYWVQRAIDDKNPPGTRPRNTNGVTSDLWSLFERSWSLDPSFRPSAADLCQFLSERGNEVAEAFD